MRAIGPAALLVVTTCHVLTAFASPFDWAGGTVDVGSTAVGEGNEREAWTAVGVKGALAMRWQREKRDARFADHVKTEGVVIGANGALQGDDQQLTMRGSIWLHLEEVLTQEGHNDPRERGASGLAFDYQLRVPLSRRRDLLASQLTAFQEHIVATARGWSDEAAAGHETFIVRALGLLVLDFRNGDREDGNAQEWAPGSNLLVGTTLYRRWRDHDGDGVRHHTSVGTFDMFAVAPTPALGLTFVLVAEQDRPIGGGIRADWRAGMTQFIDAHDEDTIRITNESRVVPVTAGIVDGALRTTLLDATFELRYDRDPYLTPDQLMAIEDRVTARTQWRPPGLTFTADAYTATTGLWTLAGEGSRAATDGVNVRATVERGRWLVDASVEAGHSYYATRNAIAAAPQAGWRAMVDVSWRLGSLRPST